MSSLSPRLSTLGIGSPSLSGLSYDGLRRSAGVSKPYAVIGIDFGTTYSGVSWTWSGNLNNTDQISSWDAVGRDKDSDKVPSRIIYDSTGEVTGWGFNTKPEGHFQVQWFKLLLSDEACEQGGDKVKEAEKILKRLQKKPVEVVADYLRQLWLHAVEVIELRISKVAFDNMDVRVVITVPANWDTVAQKRTKEAAIKAGITDKRPSGTPTLRLVTEPEAAALAAWKEAGLAWHPDLKVGDSFVVCDAGGGTVDLISYKVESLAPLRLAMCVVATGGLCGAVYLDQGFEAFIRTTVGIPEYDKLSSRVRAKFFDSDWEHGIKRSYDGGNQAWPVDIPGYKPKKPGMFKSRKSNSSTIMVEAGHANTIFQPICGKVVDLVRTQVNEVKEETGEMPRTILLVGGFGESDYLLKLLKSTFRVTIQRPVRAWSAISRGAVAKGLTTAVEDETVTNVIAKYSYGVQFQETFDPKKHLEQDKKWCTFELKDKARNQVRWYLRRGDNVKKTNFVKHNWEANLRSKWDLMDRSGIDILICESESPPSRITSEVTKLCRIETDYAKVAFDDLESRENPSGMSYRTLSYSINMKVTAEDLEWAVLFNGEERGKLTCKVEYDNV